MNDFSILIPDGESNFALQVMQCFSQVPGLKVYVHSGDRWALPRFSRHKISFIHHKREKNDVDWVNSLLKYVIKFGINVVFPVDQYAIRVLSIYGDSLLGKTKISPLPTTNSFNIAADKWLAAEFMMENNLPMPSTHLFETDVEFEQNLAGLTFPVLTKPRNSFGVHGIAYWEDEGKLRDYLNLNQQSGEKIVQSFVNGFDIDCSVLCLDGKILAYTIQKGILPGRSRFAPSGGVGFIDNQQVYELIEQLMSAMKWSGLAHIDLMYDEQDQKYKIIEINPRCWGSLLGSLSAGVNFPYLACLAGLDIEFPHPAYSFRNFYYFSSIIRMLRQGTIQKHNFKLKIDNTNIKHRLGDPLVLLGRAYKWLVKK